MFWRLLNDWSPGSNCNAVVVQQDSWSDPLAGLSQAPPIADNWQRAAAAITAPRPCSEMLEFAFWILGVSTSVLVPCIVAVFWCLDSIDVSAITRSPTQPSTECEDGQSDGKESFAAVVRFRFASAERHPLLEFPDNCSSAACRISWLTTA